MVNARDLLQKMVSEPFDVARSVKLRRDIAEAQKIGTEFYHLARSIKP